MFNIYYTSPLVN